MASGQALRAVRPQPAPPALSIGAVNALGTDFRGLSFVRMCLGALMLSDSLSRLPYLTAFHR